jgi:hypothetical protein
MEFWQKPIRNSLKSAFYRLIERDDFFTEELYGEREFRWHKNRNFTNSILIPIDYDFYKLFVTYPNNWPNLQEEYEWEVREIAIAALAKAPSGGQILNIWFNWDGLDGPNVLTCEMWVEGPTDCQIL